MISRIIFEKILMRVSDLMQIICFVFNKRIGRCYALDSLRRVKIVTYIIKCNRRIKSLTTWRQHLVLFEEIMSVPSTVKGDVVECGCYNGASTVPLSLACALTGRTLYVCDSFEGLPEPMDDEKYEIHGNLDDSYYIWERGEFGSEGGLEAVKTTVRRFGEITSCKFVKGYYQETLNDLDTANVVLVFEDADIKSSVRDCLLALWPKLHDGCKFYCHEPWSINIISLFYDEVFWKSYFDTKPPGFFGSGFGILAGTRYCNMGYAKKFDYAKIRKYGKKICHEGSRGYS